MPDLRRYSRELQMVEKEHIYSDLQDAKGRRIGFLIHIFVAAYTLAKPDGWGTRAADNCPRYVVDTHPTRWGEPFGALSKELGAETLEEAWALAKKRRAGSFKRYQKLYGGAS